MNRSSIENEQFENRPKYKVIVLGRSGVGKTKLLTRLLHDFYDDLGMATISVDVTLVKRKNALYEYNDTAGQQRYESIVDMYYKGADACLILYDVGSRKSFETIAYYYNKVKELTDDSLIYIVGCQADKKVEISPHEVQNHYKGIKSFQTSAKANLNVQQLFQEVQKDLLTLKTGKIPHNTPKMQKISFSQSSTSKPGKKCC